TTPIPAPSPGRLVITVPQGQTVKIGQVVGRVEEAAAPRPSPDSARKEKPAEAPRPEKAAEPPPAAKEEARLSPAARHRAADAGIDARQVAGTGRGGRVTKQDVVEFLEKQPPEPSPVPPVVVSAKPQAVPQQRETRQRMTSIRQRIAERLVAAQHSAA